MNDREIIDLFLERSEDAVKQVSADYGERLRRIALGVTGDPGIAEECVNDAYLGCWNAIPPARPKPLVSFVCRIVRNISINRAASKGFRQWKSNYEGCLEELEYLIPGGNDVEQSMDEKQLSACIDEFLHKQNEISRMIFVRRFYFMDSCEDIAEASGLSSGAVRTRLSRVKADLKTFLERKGWEV